MTFQEETKNRDRAAEPDDPHARATGGSSPARQVAAPPAFTYTYTGYHPIKFSTDDASMDGGSLNTNAVHLFRYAEVLLNYAEAKAELGQLTDAEWAHDGRRAPRARRDHRRPDDAADGRGPVPPVGLLPGHLQPGDPRGSARTRDRARDGGVPLLRHRALGARSAHGDGVARDLRAAGEHEHRPRRERHAGRELHGGEHPDRPARRGRHLHLGDRERLQAQRTARRARSSGATTSRGSGSRRTTSTRSPRATCSPTRR